MPPCLAHSDIIQQKYCGPVTGLHAWVCASGGHEPITEREVVPGKGRSQGNAKGFALPEPAGAPPTGAM